MEYFGLKLGQDLGNQAAHPRWPYFYGVGQTVVAQVLCFTWYSVM